MVILLKYPIVSAHCSKIGDHCGEISEYLNYYYCIELKIHYMNILPEPKSIKLYPIEWFQLQSIAQRRGISRHKLMTDAMRSILQNQNPEAA